MAQYQCDYGRHRYRQAQQTIYWIESGPHISTRRRIRLCPEHFDLLDEEIQNRMTDVDDPSEVPSQCEVCEKPRMFGVTATVYRAHSQSVMYAIELCAEHAQVLGNDLRVYNAEPLPDA